jgi:hypothetical protein
MWLLKARIVKSEKMAVARQQLVETHSWDNQLEQSVAEQC